MRTAWTHKNLEVWCQAMVLAKETYRVTRAFPPEERFGLAPQMRRAAVSIISNVAEGAARSSRPEFLHFLSIARGSLAELDAQATLALRLGIAIKSESLENRIQRVGRLLTGLISKLKKK